jgi:hypothetical protein
LQSALQMIGIGVNVLRVEHLEDLPATWVGYSAVDVVAFTAPELASLERDRPRQFTALDRWVRSGGNLWVVQCGPRWENLPALERALGGRTPTNDDEAQNTDEQADAAIQRRGWKFVPLGDRALEPFEGTLVLTGYNVGEPEEPKPQPGQPAVPTAPMLLPKTSESYFAVRAHGLGTVTAIRDGALDGASHAETIVAIQQSLLGPRMQSVSRLGNKPDEPNAEFNKWLIPGVGVAPIGTFQLLISLLVLAIGPLNYWWLKRRGKLPLLLATVPTAAAAVTVLLVAYGLFGDGLGVRVRARSFTLLDQTAGESTTWARLSYFAGVNPSEGLTLERDTVVYPLHATGRSVSRRWPDREFGWTKSQQRLMTGWLPSRTTTQFLAINARASKRRLDIRPVDGGMQIDNRLGVAVTHLVVQDRDGELYWLTDLGVGERRVAPVADPLTVSGTIRQLFSDNYPEYPPGAEPGQSGYSSVIFSRNVLETQIEAVNSPVVRGWTNGSYIAVTSAGIELELGIEGAAEESSFHVLRGLW